MAKKTEGKARHQKTEEIKKARDIRWDRLDNTAHLFPVIAGEGMTNVYRICVVLSEEVNPALLQEALNICLPRFDGFNFRLRRGVFWYYFEENRSPVPKVREESNFPCRYIRGNQNHNYLFRVTYYKCRINLEVFHVLTDGVGGINFLTELTYQYLRLAHPEIAEGRENAFITGTSMNREDSFLKNYRKSHKRGYKTKKAYLIKGEKLRPGEFGVMHGEMDVAAVKDVAHRYGCSINEYLVAAFTWSVYIECLHGMPSKKPIRVAVPVNLRPYFNSITSKNFFVVVSAEFWPKNEDYTFEDVVKVVTEGLRSQINKEHLEELFSYNVSNETHTLARLVPLTLKNLAMNIVYTQSALANTTTITNIGNIKVEDEYRPYIKNFRAFLAMSKGQSVKGTVCSYGDRLTFSFSYDLCDVSVQRGFFRRLSQDGIELDIETNGV